MPPTLSPRGIAREILSELDLRSPFHSTPRRSRPSDLVPFSLRSATARLLPRAATDVSTVPQGYGEQVGGPDPGTVIGIVLGAVAGFLLMLWLIYTCVNLGNPNTVVEVGSVGNASEVTRKSRKHRHKHRSRSPRRETVEIRRERVVPVPVAERIIVEERSRSRAPPPHMPPPPPPPLSDDEVVVIEENTPPRRRESKHKRRSSERRSSGYREVDPYRYAGGDDPQRDISRPGRRSDSRRR
jgi:hypothetical protein